MLRPAEAAVLRRDLGPIVAVGDDGRIAHADPAALRALGWTPALVGKPLAALIPDGRRPWHTQTLRLLSIGRWPPEGIPPTRSFVGQDGRERVLHSRVAVFRRPDGSRFLCGTITDDAASAGLDRLTAALQAAGYTKTSLD